MVDVDKHIGYWKGGAEEDIAAAGSLLETGHPRHALFFAHLAVEKMLKAHVTKATGDIPPKIHDLLRLVRTGRPLRLAACLGGARGVERSRS